MPAGERDYVTLEGKKSPVGGRGVGGLSRKTCRCMATAKHMRGNKMGKQRYSEHPFALMIGIFQGGNGVDTPAFRGVDDKYEC